MSRGGEAQIVCPQQAHGLSFKKHLLIDPLLMIFPGKYSEDVSFFVLKADLCLKIQIPPYTSYLTNLGYHPLAIVRKVNENTSMLYLENSDS